VSWHRQRHTEDLALIDEYFDAGAFEEELSTLPGKYSAPEGRLLLALYDSQPAGCVALRKIDTETCEMKRMFVYPQFQGKGTGKALAESIIREAKKAGYLSMKLDTSFRQKEALQLYEKMGFHKTNPYYKLPERMKGWLVFMELKLL
jgi:GNAT superfamily N-acetyltransferase